MASVDASNVQPRAKTVSAFDALMARPATSNPTRSPDVPEPDLDDLTPEH
jgi:hypothetical protein